MIFSGFVLYNRSQTNLGAIMQGKKNRRRILILDGGNFRGFAIAEALFKAGIRPVGICRDQNDFDLHFKDYRNMGGVLYFVGNERRDYTHLENATVLIGNDFGMVDGIITTGDDIYPMLTYLSLQNIASPRSHFVFVTKDALVVSRVEQLRLSTTNHFRIHQIAIFSEGMEDSEVAKNVIKCLSEKHNSRIVLGQHQ